MSEKTREILVIDDDPDIQESVHDVLCPEGYQIVSAENGEKGLDLLKTHAPGLVLLDVNMPIMNGWEFWDIYRRDPAHSEIPLLVFCAGDRATSYPPFHPKPTGFLSKPVDLNELIDSVTRFFKEPA